MRVVLIGPVYPYRGGIAHYTAHLAQALREAGHFLLLVSFKRQYPQWLFPGQSDRDPSSHPLKVQGAQYWIDPLNPFTWLTTFRRIRAYGPQAIIQQWWTPFWAPVWFALGAWNSLCGRSPLIVLCHNVLPHESHWWDAGLAKIVLRWGTGFITQSLAEKDLLLRLLPGARAVVCPHPAYDLLADQRLPREQAREQLRLPEDAPVLLFFGIVREYKGLLDLLTALPQVRERLGDVLLVVAGEFWDDAGPYRRAIRRLGIEDAVVLDARYIPNEEVAVYFSAADLLVAPYRRVTGSGTVQLAVGFGLPVVTTRVGGLAEDGRDNDEMLVPPADPKALAEAIIAHFRSLETCQSSVPKKRRSWEQVVAAVEDLAREAQS